MDARTRSCGRRHRCLLVATLALCLLAARARSEDQPLTLESALALARANHPKLARDRASVRAARARVLQARAARLPGLVGEFSFAPETPNYVPSPAFRRVLDRRTEGGAASVLATNGLPVRVTCLAGSSPATCIDDVQSPLPSASYRLYSFWTVSVGLSWTVLDWGAMYHETQATRAALSGRQERLEATLAEVIEETKLAYYDTLAAEAAVEVATEELAARTLTRDTVRVFQQAGRSTGVDVASSESALAEAELLMVRARARRDAARVLLALTIGDASARQRALVVPALRDSQLCADSARRGRDRPEVRELMHEARAEAARARALRGAYLPSLHVSAGPTWAGPQLNQLITNFGGVVGLRYPRTQGMNPLQIAGQRAEADATRAALEAEAETTRIALQLAAETACIELNITREALSAASKAVEAAHRQREQAVARYRQGAGSFLELSAAELAYVNARFAQVHARFEIGRAQSRAERALGR